MPLLLLASLVLAAPSDDFAQARMLIKPQRGEHRWAEVPWLLSVAEGQKKAAALGKPIVLARAAQGCVVGCL